MGSRGQIMLQLFSSARFIICEKETRKNCRLRQGSRVIVLSVYPYHTHLTCSLKSKQGQWINCECIVTVVYDVLIATTTIFKGDMKSQGTPPNIVLIQDEHTSPSHFRNIMNVLMRWLVVIRPSISQPLTLLLIILARRFWLTDSATHFLFCSQRMRRNVCCRVVRKTLLVGVFTNSSMNDICRGPLMRSSGQRGTTQLCISNCCGEEPRNYWKMEIVRTAITRRTN